MTSTQLLFVIDVTEGTGTSFGQILHRACLAIVQACASRGPLRVGLLTVRARGHESLCTPSGFTSDVVETRRSLRNLLFDGGLSPAAHLEGLLVAADGDWWDESADRHIVLVTHSEPHPLPASYALPGDGASASPPSLWSPVPEVLAKAGISLSVVAPRPMPRLIRLYTAVCLGAHPAVPKPTRFAEAPELYVASVLLSDGGGGAPAAAGYSAAEGRRLMSPTGTSPVGGAGGEQWGGAAAKRRKAGSPGARAASPIFHVEGEGSSVPVELWAGSLSVKLPTGPSCDLGAAVLRAEGKKGETDRWRTEAAKWGDKLRVHVYNAEERQSMLREMAREREGKPAGAGGGGGGAVLALRLAVTSRKAADLFGTLQSSGHWARLLIPTLAYGAFIADARQPGEMRGWILNMPHTPSPSPIPIAEAAAAAASSARAQHAAVPVPVAAPTAAATVAVPSAAALAAAMGNPAQLEALSAQLDGGNKVLVDALRRKVSQKAPAPAPLR